MLASRIEWFIFDSILVRQLGVTRGFPGDFGFTQNHLVDDCVVIECNSIIAYLSLKSQVVLKINIAETYCVTDSETFKIRCSCDVHGMRLAPIYLC